MQDETKYKFYIQFRRFFEKVEDCRTSRIGEG